MKRGLKILVVACCLFAVNPLGALCPTMDFTGDCRVDLEDFALFAAQWLDEGIPSDPAQMTWVSISDPGVVGQEGFIGEMGKYEVSNDQYCAFLNAALITEDIVVEGTYVKGATGTNPGVDFAGQNYYDLSGAGYTVNGAVNGGAARINWTGTSFTVDAGFENHPVTYVSWYGATSFAGYYGYRLPSEWEWQAVADFDGTYNYGCGTTINNSIANYYSSAHPDGTSVGGAFGVYGYGLADMAGNVWEWTSSPYGSNLYALRGGFWTASPSSCDVSFQHSDSSSSTIYNIGFRVCRMPEPDLTWIFVDEANFSGAISKYEITNAQYCRFLNAALTSGDITVDEEESIVYGAAGSNSGTDFVGEYYYNFNGVGWSIDGATLGGSSRVLYGNGMFYVDNGYDDFPVTFVSWYGATAFCEYYGLHLPSGAEWQAVADYDGTYNYGCGVTISNSIANYEGSTHPEGTSVGGTYGVYGYGIADMAGNVSEWITDVPYNPESRYVLGGAWNSIGIYCQIFNWGSMGIDYMGPHIGFRPCY